MDLSGLKNFSALMEKGKSLVQDQAQENGVFLVAIEDIEENSEQCRIEFDEVLLRDLAEDIRERGVKTPISLQPKNADGKYRINAGARRFRASKIAGKTHIPAHVDKDFDGYDQVNENRQRADLSPRELALFIDKRVKAGDKKGEIARRLKVSPSEISFHLALLTLPGCVNDLYESKQCRSAQLLSMLTSLYKKDRQTVEAFCCGSDPITRSMIDKLSAQIEEKHKKPSVKPAAEAEIEALVQFPLNDQSEPEEILPVQNNTSDIDSLKEPEMLSEVAVIEKEVEAKSSNAPASTPTPVSNPKKTTVKDIRKALRVQHDDLNGVLLIEEGLKSEQCCILTDDGNSIWVPFKSVRLVDICDV